MKNHLLLAALVLVVLLAGCAQQQAPVQKPMETPMPTETPTRTPTPTLTPSAVERIKAVFPSSLHATRAGKETFYSAENGGFEKLTGIPFEKLGCKNCHAGVKATGEKIETTSYEPDCYDCHKVPGDKVEDKVCYGCHGRQAIEALKLKFYDVHREKGMHCSDCHKSEDVHGDGNYYKSLLEAGAIKADCENCHEPTKNTAHSIHAEKVDCSACHVKSVISCYNCHFNSLTEAHVKRPFGPLRDFKLLVNYNGKVHSATFMALIYNDKTFVTIAPFYGHSVTKDVECGDCHGNKALSEYDNTGKIVITKWNDSEKKLTWKQGVIPVVPDWQNSFVFDFLTYTADPHNPVKPFDSANWTYVKTGADLKQMLYGEPLTDEQLEKLRMKIS